MKSVCPRCVKFGLFVYSLLYALHAQTLGGVIDIHAHHDPDLRPRSQHAIFLAKLAKDRGMHPPIFNKAEAESIFLPCKAGNEKSQPSIALSVNPRMLPEALDSDLAGEIAKFGRLIRAATPEHFVVSNHLGPANSPTHPKGKLIFISSLRSAACTPADLARVTKSNPATLLGLQKGVANGTL